LGPLLPSGHQVLNLQYADDTLLFLKANCQMFEKLKWAFKGFEGISGLKINFAKTKPVPLNLPVSDANAYAVFFFSV
jgi:hypothetical protein